MLRLKAAEDAPEGLTELLDHISRFELGLRAIHNAVRGFELEAPDLIETLRKAKERLKKIYELVKYIVTKAEMDRQVDRWQWLRRGGEVTIYNGTFYSLSNIANL